MQFFRGNFGEIYGFSIFFKMNFFFIWKKCIENYKNSEIFGIFFKKFCKKNGEKAADSRGILQLRLGDTDDDNNDWMIIQW